MTQGRTDAALEILRLHGPLTMVELEDMIDGRRYPDLGGRLVSTSPWIPTPRAHICGYVMRPASDGKNYRRALYAYGPPPDIKTRERLMIELEIRQREEARRMAAWVFSWRGQMRLAA